MSPRTRGLVESLGRNARKFVLATVCGLVLAGIAHLSAVLLLPWLAERDAFARLAPVAAASETAVLVAPARGDGFGPYPATWLPLHDPAVSVAACTYDLAEGPLRIAAPLGGLFQAISLHARGAGSYFALTDRAAVGGRLELYVVTQAQLDDIVARNPDEPPASARTAVRIVAPSREGIVVVRALAPLPSQAAAADALATAVTCTVEPL